MAKIWIMQGVERNINTGETRGNGHEKQMPEKLGRYLLQRGDWIKTGEIETEDPEKIESNDWVPISDSMLTPPRRGDMPFEPGPPIEPKGRKG